MSCPGKTQALRSRRSVHGRGLEPAGGGAEGPGKNSGGLSVENYTGE